MTKNASVPDEDSITQKISRGFKNCMASMFACCGTTKETALIKKLEYDIAARKKKFGTEYLTLQEQNATPEQLEACNKKANDDIADLKEQIKKHEEDIAKQNEERDRTIEENNAKSPKASSVSTPATVAPAAAVVEPTKVDTPKVDTPKVEAPKVDTPKVDAPKE
eukprot:CAMPEP_0195249756 /NCGR_PEP_ID=MMETSP0706-20130129/2301_1 /TAXON_ID=33640 /ORGANISM="Asterionellopsis glacialis, Strain CCMP134" /LENGTH=164 /DNA_ID=CAMNT_0040301611 /DNA_START=113 /DNA_END=607 /DNA_ORIENTATION=-